ncbi:hypothetical protein SAMN05444156_0739 [Verrucomicrobium sp. GAS474]|uniref:hypothetical protein n=1 Tax=Verrucomicrobium sp. GAS474 TaxID=1882831 RepID=UPI00087966EB|nr:hypothetical protein [Verrucomicrobium sp. GAS474]SDT91921.1 hypothetical protein SAMN05444156_0739 [Verrucomicrobium sp. GAS474]
MISADGHRRGAWGAFFLFALLPLLFALYTGNVWEDYYITYRSSQNLATGHGLVFQQGERVQTFTSPLGVLLPALCSVVTGTTHDDAALWLFRLISASALGVAGVFLYRMLRHHGVPRVPLWIGLLLVALDAKTAAFDTNGMENGFLLAFLLFSCWALTVPARSGRPWLWIGLSWAGIMWSRPDGFIYGGAPAAAVLLFGSGIAAGRAGGRLWLLRQYALALGLAVAIYLPWFIGSWAYYGTPVSNTIAAKGVNLHWSFLEKLAGKHEATPVAVEAPAPAPAPALSVPASTSAPVSSPTMAPTGGPEAPAHRSFLQLAHLNRLHFDALGLIYAPIYVQAGGWPEAARCWAWALVILGGLPLVLPGMARTTRAAAAAFLIVAAYYCYMPHASPWYLPTGAWLGYLSLLLGVIDLYYRTGLTRRLTWCAAAAVGIGAQLFLFAAASAQLRVQQHAIELGVRTPIGHWLKENAQSPSETVFLEPLGYIGYYSQLKMVDFPGLSAPEVVALRRRLHTDNWAVLIGALKPTWLVLRPAEVTMLNGDDAALLPAYHAVKTFDAGAEIAAARIYGKGYLECDQTFIVFRRND